MITQDKQSWQFGFDDGAAGHKKNRSQAEDGLAYSSGWIEGDAARQYNFLKNPQAKTCSCADCGKLIKMSGRTCFEFGIYLCLPCRADRDRPGPKVF